MSLGNLGAVLWACDSANMLERAPSLNLSCDVGFLTDLKYIGVAKDDNS